MRLGPPLWRPELALPESPKRPRSAPLRRSASAAAAGSATATGLGRAAPKEGAATAECASTAVGAQEMAAILATWTDQELRRLVYAELVKLLHKITATSWGAYGHNFEFRKRRDGWDTCCLFQCGSLAPLRLTRQPANPPKVRLPILSVGFFMVKRHFISWNPAHKSWHQIWPKILEYIYICVCIYIYTHTYMYVYDFEVQLRHIQTTCWCWNPRFQSILYHSLSPCSAYFAAFWPHKLWGFNMHLLIGLLFLPMVNPSKDGSPLGEISEIYTYIYCI